MTSSSSLGAVAEVLTPQRGRHLSKLRIEWCDPAPLDSYAPAPKRCVCRDAAGFKRKAHEYLVDSRQGRRCWACGALERMVSL
jgi:hypothetical protein